MPILLVYFGADGTVLSLALLLDGEFGASPGRAGVALGIVLIAIGMIKLIKTKKSKTE